MKKIDKLSNAIGNIDDKFILEAFKYHPQSTLRRSTRLIGIMVASICLMVGIMAIVQKNNSLSITVYAYET